MASIIKKNRRNAGKTARSVADCNFKSDLYRSEPDSETTILCADADTTVLCSDAGTTVLSADSGTTVLAADADTTVLAADENQNVPAPDSSTTLLSEESEETIPPADSDTTVLSSPEEPPNVEDIFLSEPPGTTVLNFADVKDKIPFGVVPEDDELEIEPEPQVKPASQAAPATEQKPDPKVVISVEVKGSGDVFDISKDSTTVGKSKYSDVQIKNTQTVSRTHIILHRKENRLFVEDNSSLNGTFINNEKLTSGETREVFDGDVVRISDEELIVSVKEEA